MGRYAHIAFLLYLVMVGAFLAGLTYKILTDATVPLFSLGW